MAHLFGGVVLLVQFCRGHIEKHVCEIVMNFNQWSQEDLLFLGISI